MPIRVLTWNVHGFLGQDGRFDPDRVFRVITDLKPDLLAVQEVVGPDRGVDGFGLLRAAMPGAQAIEANVERKIQGIYGQVLISRFPIRDSVKVDLSVGAREPRRAIDAMIDMPGRPMRVIATHLGLGGPERRFQIGVLCGLVEADPDSDLLLFGDINDWRRRGFAERRLSPLLGHGTRHRTFPAAFPLFPLDRIWLRPADRLLRTAAVREAGLASDHLPLVADLAPAAASARSSQASSASPSAAASAGSV